MIGMDSNENVYKQLRIDKQVAEEPSLLWVWDWLEESSEKVIIIYKIHCRDKNEHIFIFT